MMVRINEVLNRTVVYIDRRAVVIFRVKVSCITSVDGTVEPPCGTTSRKRPPPIRDRQSKTHAPKLSQSKPYSWNLL